MNQGTYVVFLGTSTETKLLCLGTKKHRGTETVCCVKKFDAKNPDIVWTLVPVPGTKDIQGFYLKHEQTGLCARFGDSEGIMVDKFGPEDTEYFMRLDSVGDGFMAINNHSADLVMDASGDDPQPEATVAPHKWNRGGNQRWRFVSTSLLA
ncbi:RICIN domain-containing protein [Dyella marensis]|jgi:hypothetical protein|uniref:Ricin B lectin domain-containing protein n=1 Tax=Dyella marensis TaxID=500610 RepID=A0A1I2JCH4_9GAMM|nr:MULTISPECIES: RICIN domain-containing protein [Dyella]SFF50381.1 hypothetical protein SAMN02799615_03867 [Dyella marensis]